MFWKRKSKKQDGQEATDSAAEAAVDKETDAVDSEEAAEKGGSATAEDSAAGAKDDTDKSATDDVSADADTVSEASDEEGEAKKENEGDKADDAQDTGSGSEAGEGDSAAEDSGDDTEGDGDKVVDLFADETEEVGVTGPDDDGITRVRTAGTFEFDGEKYEIVSNTWIVEADDEGVVVVDPAHDAEAVLEAVGERDIYLVACTNGYSPHTESAIAVAEEVEAPIALNPREMRIWRRQHGAEHRPEIEVEGGGTLDVGNLRIEVLALPGTSTGTVGYYIGELGVVFSGDTVRKGEPGMVGDTYIDYTTQLASIGESLLSLPPTTRLMPDRGPSTTSAAESRNFDSWV